MSRKIILSEVEPQRLPPPTDVPILPREVYTCRLALMRQRMMEKSLDSLVMYGDREHFANMAFASGYDPRFEEALLVIPLQGDPTLMVGNEGLGYSKATLKVDCEVLLVQPFSLMGQPRGRTEDFMSFLKRSGIKRGMRVGTAGWKYFEKSEFDDPGRQIEIPSFIVDALRQIAGLGNVINANDIFMHPEYGLRVVNDFHQIAYSEYAATIASQAIHEMIEGLELGMTEYEAVRLMKLSGLPHSFHPVLMSGERTDYGLASPSSRVIEVGDPLLAGLGFWGSAVCRAAYLVHDSSELPTLDVDYVKNLCFPYFEMMAKWYELLAIDAVAGEIFEEVSRITNMYGFKLALTPGHLTHLDEWVNTPFFEGSSFKIKSGMLLQSDFIPVVEKGHFGVNVEDTLAIADEETRYDLEKRYPGTYRRIMMRKDFVADTLGINLRSEVLPLCDNQALLRPYLLSHNTGIRFRWDKRQHPT